jgi:hypothetical protein
MQDKINPYQPGHARSVVTNFVHLVHRHGKHRIVRMGFCWTGFFLPTLWAISEGLWRIAALSSTIFAMPYVNSFLLVYSDATGNKQIAFASVAVTGASYLFYLCLMAYVGVHGQQMIVDDLLAHGYARESNPAQYDCEEDT